MKDFRSVLSDYLNKHDKHRKQLAAVVSLSMLVSFSVPMILTEPAVSMTQDSFSPVGDILSTQLFNASNGNMIGNVAGGECENNSNPEQISEVTLLMGEMENDTRKWLNGCTTAAQVSTSIRSEYFLGLASDFCVFLEGNFQPTAADAEGRVAVGGSLIFDDWQKKNHNYQVGAGDYGTSTALQDTDNYLGIKNFAHLIMGENKMNVYKQVVDTTDWTLHLTDELLYENAKMLYDVAPYSTTNNGSDLDSVDLYKRIFIPTTFDFESSKHANDSSSMEAYQNGHSHKGTTIDELGSFYQPSNDTQKLIDFKSEFSFLRTQAENLSKIKSTGDAEYKPNNPHPTINGVNQNAIIFDGKGGNEGDPNYGKDIVYFDIPSTYFDYIDDWNCQFIFENIPTYQDENGDEQVANIVVNVGGESVKINYALHTFINGTQIHANDGDYSSNNNKLSEKILYNLYEATDVVLNGGFNGTLFAPNADVRSSQECKGHLSGSLIAKSYVGGMEFGYRPYRGPVDILGSSNGYSVPFDKFILGTEKFLSGATFGIYEGEELVSTFTSGNETEYVNIPSKVDFDGDSENERVSTTKYTIKEISAPTGFVLDNETEYYVEIEETVLGGIFNEPVEGGSGILTGRPSEVKAVVTISSNKDGYTGQSFNIHLNDIWGYDESSGRDAIIRREITIGEGENAEIFYLDMGNGKITAVSKKEGEPIATATAIVTGADIVYEDASKEVNTDIPVTAYKTQVVTTEVTDEDKNIVTEVVYEADGTTPVTEYVTAVDSSPETEVVTTVVEEILGDGALTEYPMNVVHFEGDLSGEYEVTFYYNDPSKTKTYTGSTKDNENNLDLGDLDKNGVVGVAIKFDNDVSGNFFIQETENGYATIFGTGYGQSKQFNAGETYYFYDGEKNPATTTTAITSYASTVTTSITTLSYYITSSHTTEVINIDKYGTIFADVDNAHTYNTETTVADYYYDPNAMMMMPLPSQTPTFENDYGLIFAKVDDEGKSVPGATIEVQHHYYDFDDNKWKWVPIADGNNILDGGSLTTIDLKEIKDEEEWGSGLNYVHQRKVYRFVEIDNPDGYEIAVPIYFVKEGNIIHYKSSETAITSMPLDESTWAGWSSVDLTKNNTADRDTIEMVDIKISGAKIKLAKYDSDFKTPLTGATFKLHASNDELIYPIKGTFTINSENLDLYEMLRNAKKDEYNQKYVQNGYLKPGSYYLEEVTAPEGYDGQDKFGFRVKNDYSIEAVDAGTPMSDPEDMYLGTAADGNPILTITGKLLDIAKENPDEVFVDDLWKVNQVHVSSDGSNWGGNLSIANKSSYTFNEILNAANKSADEIKYVRFMQWDDKSKTYSDATSQYYDGSPASSGGSSSSNSGKKIQDIVCSEISDMNAIVDVTFYYAEGEPKTINTNFYSTQWDKGINIDSLSKENVVGVKIVGKDNLDFKVTVRENNSTPAFGNWDEIVSGTTPKTFGNCNDVTSTPAPEPNPDPIDPEEKEDLAVRVSGDIIKIPNKKSGDEITITVEKKWVNDDGFESLRPESIEVQLKRKKSNGSEDDEFNKDTTYKATLDNDHEWKNSWSGLDRLETSGDEDSSYIYYVEEIGAIENYTVSYDNNGDGKNDTLTSGGTLKITNTLNTIDIDIEKIWNINDCDDAVIPDDIEVKVQFRKTENDEWADVKRTVETTNDDGETVSSQEPLTLTLKKDDWSGTVEKLPDIYEYRFVEIDVPTGWESDNSDTAKKGDLSASITNTFMTGKLGIEKNWANDSATDRPDSLTISLYRTTKAPETDEDTQVNQLAENAEEAISTETYEDIIVTEGETIVLSTGDEGVLILDSEKPVEWNDTENDKIKVEDGILTVLDEGITTISATIDDTPTIFNVNVKIASVIPEVSGMQKVKDIETFDKSDNTWTANVDNLPLYSPDGKTYYYYIVEKYTGADGKTVTGNNCTYYSVNYSDAVTLIGNPSTTPKLSVTNKKVDTEGITLPEAGGNGTHNYYIAGICLIGMAGMFWFIRRRRTAK